MRRHRRLPGASGRRARHDHRDVRRARADGLPVPRGRVTDPMDVCRREKFLETVVDAVIDRLITNKEITEEIIRSQRLLIMNEIAAELDSRETMRLNRAVRRAAKDEVES